jgi:hypothetical protein
LKNVAPDAVDRHAGAGKVNYHRRLFIFNQPHTVNTTQRSKGNTGNKAKGKVAFSMTCFFPVWEVAAAHSPYHLFVFGMPHMHRQEEEEKNMSICSCHNKQV